MKKVDLLLSNATVMTMDSERRILRPGSVAILDGVIAAVGPVDEVDSSVDPAERVDCRGRLLMPGLINAHTHVPMTLLRGLEDDSRLDVWLMGYMMPVEREFVTPEFCRLGTLIACAEMIRSGITCFADMYYFEDAVAEATASAGMRAMCSQSILKFPTPDAYSYEESLAAARKYMEKWKDHPLIVASVAPHAPYTTTPEILEACRDLCLEFDVPLHTHIAETPFEVENWRKQYDMPVIPWIKKLGMLEAKLLAAHCVHIDGGEIRSLQNAGAGVAHNPTSNLKLASGIAPVSQMLDAELKVGIGTDGPSSNNDLDMFEEIRLASLIAKVATGDPTVLPAKQVVEMATCLGAEAIHLGDKIGSLELGKMADLILIDQDQIHSLPRFERDEEAVYTRLVYSSKASDVTDVLVAGNWLMRDKQLLTIDVEPLLIEAQAYAKEIDRFLIDREESVLSKLVAIGGAEQQESYEVQLKVRLDDPEETARKINDADLDIVRRAHYREFDSYFSFEDASQGKIRYREDEFIDESGDVIRVRYRLTLIGPAAEREFENSALLSRSRFIAPATHSLRFYIEYFRPVKETTIQKDRLRWLVLYEGEELFLNIDRVLDPPLPGSYLEIKSRTWSRVDAESKATLLSDLLKDLELGDAVMETLEYPDLIAG